MSEEERVDPIRRCEEAVERFKQKRGLRFGTSPARTGNDLRSRSLRHAERAGFRCELCGVSADERALDVDHIVPRKHGGTDDPENLQALCWQCNANKGAGDDADFKGIRETYATRQEGSRSVILPAGRRLPRTRCNPDRGRVSRDGWPPARNPAPPRRRLL